MTKAVLGLAAACLAAGTVTGTAQAATDGQVRKALLTTREMARAAKFDHPLMTDEVTCDAESGLPGCSRTTKPPGGVAAPDRVAFPAATSVLIATDLRGARDYLAGAKDKAAQSGFFDLSTATRFVATTESFPSGNYLSRGVAIVGTTVIEAVCLGKESSSQLTSRCVMRLLDAQAKKAASLR